MPSPVDPAELARALEAPRARVRKIFYGAGEKLLGSGRRQWWAALPARAPMRLERVIVASRTARPFAIRLYGWRVGELALDYGAEPPRIFSRERVGGEWLHPLFYGVQIDPGQSIELDVENLQPGRAVMARAGLIGVALEADVARLAR